MKKNLFLLLALIGLSAAGAHAQVLIGGNGTTDTPHEGAILDLSKTAGKGLLLPKVDLLAADDFTVADASLQGAGEGMLVYNTGNTWGTTGVYVWNGAKWSKTGTGSSAPSINPGDYPTELPPNAAPQLAGTFCFNVTTDAPGTQIYEVQENGTKEIANVTWEVNATSAFLLQANAASGTLNEVQTLTFNPVSILQEAVISGNQTVVLTAYIDYSDDTSTQISRNVLIRNTTCCTGFVVPNGTWVGDSRLSTGFVSWAESDNRRTQIMRDLCVESVPERTALNSDVNHCNDKNTEVEKGWRLPNPYELGQLDPDGPAAALRPAIFDSKLFPGYGSYVSGSNAGFVGWSFVTHKLAGWNPVGGNSFWIVCVRTL
ncbi:MAG: hypothetical protein LBO74_15380 [Candidatus Symbiothrix sp.]|jgi:hypothetical protein|nr:hypothetical protein [Candidatus Symbiothrix sp.]